MGVFKSYDIRGIYPTQLDAALGRKIGAALGRHLSDLPENQGKAKLRVVVGRDMRLSAPEMSEALIDGLRSSGHDVIDIGMVTTPCQYFAIQRLRADAGVMCTASHNPPQYIGYKVSKQLAIPLSFDTGLNDVEARLDEPAADKPRGGLESQNVDEAYLDFLATLAHPLANLKVVADASNGMAGKYLPGLFQRLGLPLEGLYLEPDGTFPNHEADPIKPANLAALQERVRATGASVGFCYDGDADRMAVVDERGEIVRCDLVTALLAADALAETPKKPVTYDLRSSKVVADTISAAGGEPVRIRVGHSHAKQAMRKLDAILGGELSGHYFFKMKDTDIFYADAALVATVHFLNLLSKTGKKVSELVAPLLKYFHTGEINFKVENKDGALAEIRTTFADAKQDELDGVTVQYADWWFNVRPSNTEPFLRLTLEGDTAALRDNGLERVLAVLNRFGSRVTENHHG